MPRNSQSGTLLAGNISVSLNAAGSPTATLNHPNGGSCQFSVLGACVTSWRAKDGAERLLAGDMASPLAGTGGLLPCNLDCIPPDAWVIETMLGSASDGAVVFSVFAEGTAEDDVPYGARCTVYLFPERLSVSLEVGNAAEEDAEDAAPGSPPTSRLNLLCCGLHGHCRAAGSTASPETAAQAPEAAHDIALRSLGLRLRAEGFTNVSVSAAGDGNESVPAAAFKALSPTPVVLGPGETVSGSVCLEVL
mmetsp:Transcript_116157/g.375323  ORF Transcript_116157/g.375323 Transcript_116157/m.375323 type:complete len:249 (-) Transcript_116157:129-875(-)